MTISQLPRGQTLITTITIGARRLVISPGGENLGRGKNLFLQVSNLLLCVKKLRQVSPVGSDAKKKYFFCSVFFLLFLFFLFFFYFLIC